jgi:hypothetical protein
MRNDKELTLSTPERQGRPEVIKILPNLAEW